MSWHHPLRPCTRGISLALLLVCLTTIVGHVIAQFPAAVNGSGNGFVHVQLPAMGVYKAAVAEDLLTTALATRFPSASSVQCVDMRGSPNATTPPSLVGMPFALLFLVGDNPFTNGSAIPTELSPLSVNATALEADLLPMLASIVPSTSGFSLGLLTPAAVTASFGLLPLLQSITPNTSAFLRVDMSFRNVLSPANLTQNLLYQTRRGLQTFLHLTSLAHVIPTGPPQVPLASVLLVTQSFWIVLNNNASDATMDNRQRLANLLLYGDPSRLVVDLPSSSGDPRPSMFLDFAVENEPPVDPTVLLTLPYVFSSLSVDVLPNGNAPPPEPTLPPGTTVLPATPTDQLLARVRKRHVFAFALQDETLPTSSDTTCPSIAGGGLCVKLQWNNTLDGMAFWVESLESLDALTWNVAPATRFCAASETPLPLLPSPSIPLGVSPTVWAIAPLATGTSRVAFALQLRSRDDNATRLSVEIAADIRSPLQAATTVTSIARRVSTDTGVPLYATRSNVVVSYDTQFRASSNELTLLLTLEASAITQKDTSQPCAHCQNLYEWCAAQAACQAISNCVFRDGIEAAQLSMTLLQAPTLVDSVVDVSLILRRCLEGVDMDPLLLFASAVRCQLQRQCSVRTPMDYGLVGVDDRLLLWEASDGVVQLSSSPAASSSWPSSNITLRLLDTPLCTFSPTAFGPNDLEEFVTRQCVFASHLGRVTVTPLANASSLELRFQDVVGPLPSIDTGVSTNTSAVVTALPTLRLRLERTDFATALPPLPPTQPPSAREICRSTCHTLVLDQCLRDRQCVAFTDCLTRSLVGSQSTGDAVLGLFERRVVGESLSLHAAVETCEPSATDTGTSDASARRAWRLLVAASACFAKWDCPLSLQGVVLPPAPDGDAIVGKWRFRPTATATQRLFYEQQPDDDGVAMELLLTDGLAAVTSTLEATALATALRSLLQFEEITVSVFANATDATTGRRRVQWDIAYAFWLGHLPGVVEAALAPRWRLVDMPSETPMEVVVEMVAYDNSTSTSQADAGSTTHLVEMATAAVPMS